MSNNFTQEQLNNYLVTRQQYKQTYLENRQKQIDAYNLFVEQQNYYKKHQYKNQVLTDLYLGNMKSLKRTNLGNKDYSQMLMQVLKNIN
jgi:hypothetical protein